MSTRKVHQAPKFVRLESTADLRRVLMEIHKMRPEFEASVENCEEQARGRIQYWDPVKKLFTVRWSEITETFVSACGERTGLRSFFKVKLLSTQLFFRSELIRRLPDGTFQYRIPTEFFQSQLRKSLRIPLDPGTAVLQTPVGRFGVLDLSASGARIALPKEKAAGLHRIESCTLHLGKLRITCPGFGITLTHRDARASGCRFHGLTEAMQIEIKQFLIETLHRVFKGAPE